MAPVGESNAGSTVLCFTWLKPQLEGTKTEGWIIFRLICSHVWQLLVITGWGPNWGCWLEQLHVVSVWPAFSLCFGSKSKHSRDGERWRERERTLKLFCLLWSLTSKIKQPYFCHIRVVGGVREIQSEEIPTSPMSGSMWMSHCKKRVWDGVYTGAAIFENTICQLTNLK